MPQDAFCFQQGSRERDFWRQLQAWETLWFARPEMGPLVATPLTATYVGGRSAAALPHFRPRKPKLRPEEKEEFMDSKIWLKTSHSPN